MADYRTARRDKGNDDVGEVTEQLLVARPQPAGLPQDLWPRVLSAMVLATVAIACNWAGAWPFAALVLAVALAMGWEWSRIVRGVSFDWALVVQGLVIAIAVVLAVFGFGLWGVALVLAGAVVVLSTSSAQHAAVSACGVVYIGLPAIAMIWMRGDDGYGALAIMFIYAIVWTTDTFAYICGRLIGGPKLWPALSPRKTWAGTVGGVVFAGMAAAAFAVLIPGNAPLALAVAGVGLSLVAQVGDLGESAFKRAFDVKNASDLIPGHGGFMDRMDGIVAAAAAAALLAFVRGGPSPSQALLFW